MAAIAIDAQYAALLVFRARSVLDFLLNGSPEKALRMGRMENVNISAMLSKSQNYMYIYICSSLITKSILDL